MDNVRHKIMLVDDNMATLNQGKSLLQPFYKVYTIKSSAILFENLEHYTPDVILLDVEMPEMDGFETITKLKTDARFKDIPVIFLTSKSDEESERKGFSLGAVDYITKPFSGPLLLKRISNQILHKRVQAAAKDYANNVEAMEREIVKAEERIRIMLNATPLCCELWDADFNIIDCNEETVKFFGLSSKQEYIDNVFKFTPEFQSDGERSDEKVVKCLNKALDEGRYVFDWVHLAPDGTMVPVESTLVRVDYKDNYMVAAYSRDLREYKKMMQEINDTSALLESALEQATTASKAKGNFLSTMSHEMRTPMNAIIGMTAIGKKAEGIEEKNHALNKIGDASSHLLGVINDVLDMAKIEADKLELAPIEYNFERMLQKVITVVNFRAEEKKQELTININKNIPRFIVGDDQRLAQVIANLLSNAVKFTPEGGNINLEVSLISETDGICELHIEVTDSGIGITPEHQERLFHAFEQAETWTSREYGGTGLGLVISKRIIELMGGRIWVESELGKGARFIVAIEARRGEKSDDNIGTDATESDSVVTDDEFKGRKLLLAEDVEINREILISLLENTGLEIDCVENGREAFEAIEAAPDKYDIVFMDLQMPEMDGYEATQKIRALPERARGRLPIVAMTANVFKADIEKCLESGMDDHLGKPLDIDRLFEKLRKYLKQ